MSKSVMDVAAADEFFGLVQQLQESRVYQSLEGIRTTAQDQKVVSKSENQINDDKSYVWLQSMLSALTINDLKQAQSHLLQFNKMFPSEQSEHIKAVLEKIRTTISQKSEEVTDPNIFIFENLINTANKAILAKKFEKAQDFLLKAVSIKPTPKVQQILESVQLSIKKQQDMVCQKMIECAMTAIDDDEYDVAEILLKSTWIQHQHETAKKMHETYFKNLDSRRIKNIKCKTADQRKIVSEKYVKSAEILISSGLIKVAESMLIIAHNTDDSSRADELLREIHLSLYHKNIRNRNWDIGRYTQNNNGENCYSSKMPPTDSVKTYKCYYFLRMACRAFYYADDIPLAEKFLKEAERLCPNQIDVKKYFKQIAEAKTEKKQKIIM